MKEQFARAVAHLMEGQHRDLYGPTVHDPWDRYARYMSKFAITAESKARTHFLYGNMRELDVLDTLKG